MSASSGVAHIGLVVGWVVDIKKEKQSKNKSS